MASSTTNLGLRKPDTTDNWSVQDDFNANMEKIDTFAGTIGAKLFLLGNAQTISSATNFNNLIDIKNYVISTNAVAAACDNCPSSSAGKLCTWTIDGGGFDRTWAYGGQIYIDIPGNEYRRQMSTNGSKTLSFGQWVKVVGNASRTLTASTGYSKRASCRLTRTGNVCTLAMDIEFTAAHTIGATYEEIATFDSADSPGGDVFGLCYRYNDSTVFALNVYNNRVMVRALPSGSGASLPSGTILRGTMTWIAGN